MKILLINGSPKTKQSASAALLDDCKACFSRETEWRERHASRPVFSPEDAAALSWADSVVFAFPLYADGIPSHLLSWLRQAERSGSIRPQTRIYGMVNSGFFEGEQNALALAMLKSWSRRAGAVWGQGLGIGGGGALTAIASAPLGKGPKRDLGRAMEELVRHIETGASAEERYVHVNFPRFLYIWSAQMGWRSQAKKNGLTRRDLDRRR